MLMYKFSNCFIKIIVAINCSFLSFISSLSPKVINTKQLEHYETTKSLVFLILSCVVKRKSSRFTNCCHSSLFKRFLFFSSFFTKMT